MTYESYESYIIIIYLMYIHALLQLQHVNVK